jgi:hypothetical protein
MYTIKFFTNKDSQQPVDVIDFAGRDYEAVKASGDEILNEKRLSDPSIGGFRIYDRDGQPQGTWFLK